MGKQNDAPYTFVDVGQGDCLHIKTADGRNYLMDGGGKYDYNVGKNILEPYLLKNGVGRLDGVFVSHLHMDHFKGLVELMGQIDVDAVYVYDGCRVSPETVTHMFQADAATAAEDQSADYTSAPGPVAGPIAGAAISADYTSAPDPVASPIAGAAISADYTPDKYAAFNADRLRYLAAGDTVLIGGSARAEILFPPRRDVDEYEREMFDTVDENQSCLIVRFENKGVSVLMTGDLSKDGEKEALGISDLSCDILKVGHHGSKTSTSEAFLAATRPAAAVIQVGKNNYGHPSPEVIELLAASGIPVYRNDRSGAILIRPHDGGFAVQTVKRDFISPMLLKPFEK